MKQERSFVLILGVFGLLYGPSTAMAQLNTFGVLSGTTVTNTGPTVVAGNLGVSPGSSITGFPPGIVIGTIHAADATALQAQTDLTTLYNQLAGTACTSDLTGTDLGGLTLTPGVYCFTAGATQTGVLTLDAQGNPNAIFLLKVGTTLVTATEASVNLINGASSCGVYWQVGASATLGTLSNMVGNLVALTSITITTGATLNGRALARNGAVTLDTDTVAACTGGPAVGPGLLPPSPSSVPVMSIPALAGFALLLAGLAYLLGRKPQVFS